MSFQDGMKDLVNKERKRPQATPPRRRRRWPKAPSRSRLISAALSQIRWAT